GYDGAGTRDRALSDRDRRDHHRIDSETRAVADHGLVLRPAVVVRGDRPGTDVHVLADVGIAQVAEVLLLRPGTDAAVLDLGEVPDPAARPHLGPRSEMRVRADLGVLGHGRLLERARPDRR